MRYLELARERFGREDLAVVSYHMGMGNLESVLAAYGDDRGRAGRSVYFDATPRNHPRAYRLLSGFGDDSATYLWRVYAAREIMRLYREDPDELRRRARAADGQGLGRGGCSTRHARPKVFESPDELDDAYRSGELRPFEGIQRDAARPAERASWPAASTPSAASTAGCGPRPTSWPSTWPRACAACPARARRWWSRAPCATRVPARCWCATTRSPRASTRCTPPASPSTCGATTRAGRQAVAFQYMLDRLQSLNLIAWVREPGAIHITPRARRR